MVCVRSHSSKLHGPQGCTPTAFAQRNIEHAETVSLSMCNQVCHDTYFVVLSGHCQTRVTLFGSGPYVSTTRQIAVTMRASIISVLSAAVVFCGALNAAVASPEQKIVYPLFRQCDPAWGSNEMGVNGPGERATICKEGCAMSSLSMALAGLGVSVEGKPANPGTVNAWLETHNGYTCAAGDCNNLVLSAPQRLTPVLKLVGEIEKPPVEEIRANLTAQAQVFIAHVHDRTHFVLLTGWSEEAQAFTVNDPFYNTTVRSPSCLIGCSHCGAAPSPSVLARVVCADVHLGFYRGHYHLRDPAACAGYAARYDVAINRRCPVQVPAVQTMQQELGQRHHCMPASVHCSSSLEPTLILVATLGLLQETTTVCAVGCLMSSISMAIHGKDIPIPANTSSHYVPSNPGTLNTWLRDNDG